LVELLPEPEAMGLLALMLCTNAPDGTRATPSGDLGSCSTRDRTQWNRAFINEGVALVGRALPLHTARPVLFAGGDCRRCTRTRLVRNDRPAEIVGLMIYGRSRTVAGRRTQPRGGSRDARRTRGRAGARRRYLRAGTSPITACWRTQPAPTCAGGWTRKADEGRNRERAGSNFAGERRFLERRLADHSKNNPAVVEIGAHRSTMN
jgi:hypothetical protein